jgi:CSLREA domain-containing protein
LIGVIARTLRLDAPVLLATLLLALAVAAVAPLTASALTYEVDSTADEADEDPGAGGCETAAGACTLRAALEESNDSAVDDEVTFVSSFNGKTGDTITLTLGDLVIKEPVVLEGNQGEAPCETSATVPGPCLEVTGGGFNVEGVEGAGAVIRGIAITGAISGVDVLNKSTSFVAQNDWIGVKLNGSAGANNTGIFLDPESDGATIGGVEPSQRNVFGNNNNEGLDLLGAGFATVQGNYFGVAPDGKTQAANGKNIEISDSSGLPAFKAKSNEIGGTAGGEALTTVACDGPCNVISGALSEGIDLNGNSVQGEAAATGPTTIHGNYIGLAAGGEALGNAGTGVFVGQAKGVTIGGPLGGDANHLNGGNFGILAGSAGVGADSLEIEGNLIGMTVPGTSTLQPPSTAAISVDSAGVSSLGAAAGIGGNRISMLGGVGIEQHGPGATIAGNEISGGLFGIRAYGSVGAQGNTIEANLVANASEAGMQLENDANTVRGNDVEGSGGVGILVGSGILTGPASGNLIGGDTAAGENTIANTAGAAIVIAGEESIQNEVRRNNGTGNGGLFIDLGDNGPGNSAATGPNGGIQVPVFAGVTVSGVSGTAEPGAKVRVFRKQTASSGELRELLVEATADGSGNWSATYGSSLPAGTNVAASQTTAAKGTSELAAATIPADPIDGGGAETGTGTVGVVPIPVADTTAPTVKITKAPKPKSTSTTAKFKFKSNEAGSTFECKLDKGKFKKCKSPKTYKQLKPGKHVFKVRAIDKAGNVGKAAKRKFTVLE